MGTHIQSNSKTDIIQEIAHNVGTPLYLYDANSIRNHFNRLKGSLMDQSMLYYSMKANPAKAICSLLTSLGAGIEIASKGELEIALEAGTDPQMIVFSGPGKTREELEFALSKRIKLINIDSIPEARMINEIAENINTIADISIRINPSGHTSSAKIKMSGISSQFGIEETDLNEAIFSIMTLDHVNLCGFQMYMGTQMLDPEDIYRNTDYALNLFSELADTYGIQLKTVNVGGGFGIKYFEKEKDLNLEELKDKMKELSTKYKDKLLNTEVLFESGRFITAEAGDFVTKVLYVKNSKGSKFVICDGGSNFHSAAAFLGRFVRNNFPLSTIPEGTDLETTTVVGPLCTPLDVLGQKVQINADIQPGDYVVINKSGAYGLTYSPTRFLSHDLPKEVLIFDDTYSIL